MFECEGGPGRRGCPHGRGRLGSSARLKLVVDLVVGLTYPIIGAVVLAARPLGRGTRGLAWVMLGSGLAAALTALTAAVALVAPEAMPGVRALA